MPSRPLAPMNPWRITAQTAFISDGDFASEAAIILVFPCASVMGMFLLGFR